MKVLFAKGFSLTSGSLEGQELLTEAAGAIRKEGDPEVGPLFSCLPNPVKVMADVPQPYGANELRRVVEKTDFKRRL